VDLPKTIQGKSGAKHKFDLVASAGNKKDVLLGDFALSADGQVIIASFAKRYDINPAAKSFVVTYTQSSPEVEALSKTYGISIIHIGDEKVPIEFQLARMLGGTPQVVPSASFPAPKVSVPRRSPARKLREAESVRATPGVKKETKPLIQFSNPPEIKVPTKNPRKKEEPAKSVEYYFANDFDDEEDTYLS
jgi:hypothetical protein